MRTEPSSSQWFSSGCSHHSTRSAVGAVLGSRSGALDRPKSSDAAGRSRDAPSATTCTARERERAVAAYLSVASAGGDGGEREEAVGAVGGCEGAEAAGGPGADGAARVRRWVRRRRDGEAH